MHDQQIEELIAENIDKDKQLAVFRGIMLTLLKFMVAYPDRLVNEAAAAAIDQLQRRLSRGTPSVDMDS
jgi:hypothetical protein